MKLRTVAILAVASLLASACSNSSTATPVTATTGAPSATAAPSLEVQPADSPTPSVTPSPVPTALGIATLSCYNDADDDVSTDFLVQIVTTGTPDFKKDVWWTQTYDCTAVRDDVPLTPVETAALKASAGAGDSIEDLYGYCGTVDPDDYYADSTTTPSDGQSSEIAGTLILCPQHPQAPAWRKALARGRAAMALEKAGRTFASGVFLVGKDIQPGTYVVTGDIENCYWERQNRNGGIIANDFINAARRVQVTIRKTDYAFSSDGCGQWKPA